MVEGKGLVDCTVNLARRRRNPTPARRALTGHAPRRLSILLACSVYESDIEARRSTDRVEIEPQTSRVAVTTTEASRIGRPDSRQKSRREDVRRSVERRR